MSRVAVNAEQSDDWNGASGREFVEQRERHERMRAQLTRRLLAAARIQVAEARRLAAVGGVTNARFEVVDAQVHPFPAGVFDLMLGNFGIMFFDDPAAAFGNLRGALRPGGRLAFLCWRGRDENPFFTIGFAGAAAELGLRELPGPGAPSPSPTPSG